MYQNILDDICDVLRDLVHFVQFKKREKHPWRSVTFSEVAGSRKTSYMSILHLQESTYNFQ